MMRRMALANGILLSILFALLGCAQPAPSPTGVPSKAPGANAVATSTQAPAKSTVAQEATKPAAPASSPTAAAKSGQAAAGITLGTLGNQTDAPIMIADSMGYFKDLGLDVKFTRFDSAVQMIAPLGTGQLDIGGGTVSVGLFNAILRGVEMKIVADKSSMLPGRAALNFVVRKDLADQIKDYADLKGRNIAITGMASSSEVELYEALRKGNLKLSDVNVVSMPFPDRMVAFSNKALDAGISIEPYTAQAVEQGLIVRWKSLDEIYPNHQVGTVMYAPGFMKDRPDAARSFMVAYVKGIRDYLAAFTKNKNKAEIVSIMVKYSDVKDPALYDKMAISGIDPEGYVHVNSLMYDQDYFVNTGQMDKKLDFSKVVDNQYVDYAVKQLGRYQQ